MIEFKNWCIDRRWQRHGWHNVDILLFSENGSPKGSSVDAYGTKIIPTSSWATKDLVPRSRHQVSDTERMRYRT
ncbi:hypothetical protein PC129_g9888 [Phytophthora cactorum]|uniref:Uncharacterized protein n=1 Tax=Phytophthora cactorum TaxID=29920 RepID=A0A8T1GJE6_9STRA|nr:hypothetical protein PC111_g10312 [Phytophthora cactorum]KAG2922161.1 hypothetical protein PC114_g5373 [Phytophthora cactorum]KAG2929929.1 hypothetical protein PC115_g6705 [Phytophthora cactorum]KAG2993080.1 hypothetical protein PC118_g4208 [Phytophthora cactorum]KAG3177212.1 hypothetical protein C6341_g8580 [Phytophthora cactorum]